ncbi:MAG TPA: hypothetical protein VGF94_19750 [Kofleriaceae bacterium]|jgi:hypothetical protein
MRRALLVLAACGVNKTPQPAPQPQLPDCVPRRTGQITADTLPIALGATLDFYADANKPVDLTAQAGVFDLAQQFPDDPVVALGPVALGAQWYAASFPAGQFVVDAGGGLDGIYHQDAQALWLDGTASQQPGAMKTLIAYPAPLPVLRFPLADAAAWSATGTIDSTAVIDGLPFLGTDRIEVDVAAGEQLEVPYVEFSPILRVRTLATRAPTTGSPALTKRTTIFLFECFGEVARAESNPDEPNADFTTAALLRRYALGEEPN